MEKARSCRFFNSPEGCRRNPCSFSHDKAPIEHSVRVGKKQSKSGSRVWREDSTDSTDLNQETEWMSGDRAPRKNDANGLRRQNSRSFAKEEEAKKLKICKYFAKGHCRQGANCAFSHVNAENDDNDSVLAGPRKLMVTRRKETQEEEDSNYNGGVTKLPVPITRKSALVSPALSFADVTAFNAKPAPITAFGLTPAFDAHREDKIPATSFESSKFNPFNAIPSFSFGGIGSGGAEAFSFASSTLPSTTPFSASFSQPSSLSPSLPSSSSLSSSLPSSLSSIKTVIKRPQATAQQEAKVDRTKSQRHEQQEIEHEKGNEDEGDYGEGDFEGDEEQAVEQVEVDLQNGEKEEEEENEENGENGDQAENEATEPEVVVDKNLEDGGNLGNGDQNEEIENTNVDPMDGDGNVDDADPVASPSDPFASPSDRDLVSSHSREDRTSNTEHGGFVGKCMEMCPPTECASRMEFKDVHYFELAAGSTYAIDPAKAVKKYDRSAAGKKETPDLVRLPHVLKRTMNYLVNNILDRQDRPFIDVYIFLADRMRGIIKDFIVQSNPADTSPATQSGAQPQYTQLSQVPERKRLMMEQIEQVVRVLILCQHRLCTEPDQGKFSLHTNMSQLTKSLVTLHMCYGDLGSLAGDNEAEFQAYHLLIVSSLKPITSMKPAVRKSQPIKFATEVFMAMETKNYARFFRLVRSATYLQACLLHKYFSEMRLKALVQMSHSYSKQARYPLANFCRLLCFDDEAEATEFCERYELDVDEDGIKFSRVHEENGLPPPKQSNIITDKQPQFLRFAVQPTNTVQPSAVQLSQPAPYVGNRTAILPAMDVPAHLKAILTVKPKTVPKKMVAPTLLTTSVAPVAPIAPVAPTQQKLRGVVKLRSSKIPTGSTEDLAQPKQTFADILLSKSSSKLRKPQTSGLMDAPGVTSKPIIASMPPPTRNQLQSPKLPSARLNPVVTPTGSIATSKPLSPALIKGKLQASSPRSRIKPAAPIVQGLSDAPSPKRPAQLPVPQSEPNTIPPRVADSMSLQQQQKEAALLHEAQKLFKSKVLRRWRENAEQFQFQLQQRRENFAKRVSVADRFASKKPIHESIDAHQNMGFDPTVSVPPLEVPQSVVVHLARLNPTSKKLYFHLLLSTPISSFAQRWLCAHMSKLSPVMNDVWARQAQVTAQVQPKHQ